MDEKIEYKNIMKILDDSIVISDYEEQQGMGQDLQAISKELTDDKNVFRFSRYNDYINWYDAILQAIRDKPFYNKWYGENTKTRYAFLDRFLYHYHIGRGAIKSRALEKYTELASGLLGFESYLEYRKAGTNEYKDDKKGIVDRLKK